PRFAALRPVQASRQRPGRQTAQLAPLPTAAAGLLRLPALPEALRTRLCAAHSRAPKPCPSRQPTCPAEAITARPPLPARRRRSRCPHPSRLPQSRLTVTLIENKIPVRRFITA